MKQLTLSQRFGSRTLGRGVLVLALLAPLGAGAQEPGDFERMSSMLEVMNGFYDLMESVHASAEDPTKAALIQMHEIQEIYKNRGELRKVIPIYEEVLAKSDDPTIRAVAHMKLADTLKKLGETSEAIRVLREGLAESIERAAAAKSQ